MKHLITFLLALASTFAQAQATGDFLFQRKSASAFTSAWLTPSGTNLIGFNGSGGLTSVAQSTFLTPAQGNAAYSLLGHTHTASQVTDFNTAGDARWALISHTHGPADLTGFGANGGYLRSNGTAWVRVSGIAWADLTSVPAPVTALTGTNTGDQTITLTGDVTGSGTGSFAATIANQVVTFAKMQHIASAHLLGRHGSGNGDVQQINIDGGLELQGANLRRAALTGDVTTSAGSNATTIANDAVTNAKAANMAQATVKGRASGAGTGDPTDLTPDQVSTILDGATNPFLRTSAATSGITHLTGDVTAGPGSGSQAATLASVIAAGGPTGSASVVPVITYDAKGRLTTVSTATITPAAIGAPSGSGTSSGTNSGDLTLAGTPTYITIAGQTITRGQVGLTTDVTGRLPFANLVQGTAGSRLIGTRASGPGSFEEITLGTGLSMSSSTLNGLPDQTISNSSDATSHTVTLSASGGSVQLIEGSNITLTTGGTASAGTVTIASTGGGSSVVVKVRVASTGNITTISSALNAGDVIDGVTLVAGDYVLIKDQSSPAANGVYVAGVSPARATEYDTYNENAGAIITVMEGTVNADRTYLCTSNPGGTIGVTSLVWAPLPIQWSGITGTPTTLSGYGILADVEAGFLSRANNLLDLGDLVEARTNLGLGPLATAASVSNLSIQLQLTGTITPSTITADQNNYAPTGYLTNNTWRLSSDASRTITGMARWSFGAVYWLFNVGVNNIVLSNENASSTAQNRFRLGADYTLAPNKCVAIWWDVVTERWRMLSDVSPASAGSFDAAKTMAYTAAY